MTDCLTSIVRVVHVDTAIAPFTSAVMEAESDEACQQPFPWWHSILILDDQFSDSLPNVFLLGFIDSIL